MKQTWKFRSLASDAVATMASARSLSEAGRRLGLHKSSVSRLVKAGKLPPPGGRRRSSVTTAAPAGLTAAGWLRRIRRKVEASETESVGLDLMATCQEIAQDINAPKLTRLAAMARWQALAKQLGFEDMSDAVEEEREETEPPARGAWPRVAG